VLEDDYSELIGDLLDFGIPEEGVDSARGTPRSARLARALSSKFTRISRAITPRSGLVTADSSPRRVRDTSSLASGSPRPTASSDSPPSLPVPTSASVSAAEPIDKPMAATELTGEQLFEWEGYVTLMREKFYQDMDQRWHQRLAEKQVSVMVALCVCVCVCV
jgi:hypothetical protein